MNIILKELVSCGKVNEEDCDQILLEFLSFLNSVGNSNDFKNFNISTQRLDVFLKEYLCTDEYRLLWGVIKRLLLLSHGQASVERGFSINRQIETENLKKETYIAKRLVKDGLAYNGGAKNIEISKEMKIAVRGARQKYRHHLELKAAERELESKKRKGHDQEIQELRSKKVCLEKTVVELGRSADRLLEQAEAKESLLLLKQANSFRVTVKEKQSEIEAINEKINELTGTLKK